MRRLSGLALACLLAAAGVPVCAQPAPGDWGMAQLMQTLAGVHAASASFTERENLQMLAAPLLTSGTLHYVAPDYVQKLTTAPAPQNFVLDHGKVTISSGPGSQTRVFSLNQAPQIAGLVEAIRATLAGDLPALQRYYTVQLTGDAAAWQLRLQPRDAGLAHFVNWISVRGSGDRISQIDTASFNGDATQMQVDENPGDGQ